MRSPLLSLLLCLAPVPLLAQEVPPDPATAEVKEARRAFEAAAVGRNHKAMRRWIPALARIGTRRAIDPVLERFEVVRQDPATWRAARAHLAKLSNKAAWKRVVRAALSGKGTHLRVFAIEVVDLRGLPEDDEVLLKLLRADGGAVRRRAILALRTRKRGVVIEGLIAHMEGLDKDPDAEHQQCAVTLAALLGTRADKGEDYRALWPGSLAAWEKKAAERREAAQARDKKAAIAQVPTPASPWKGKPVEAGAKLFEKPLPEAAVLVQLVGGTQVEVIGRDGSWWRVRASIGGAELSGYVSAKQLVVKAPPPPAAAKAKKSLTTFYDVPLVGKGIVFLFDFSSSMVKSRLLKGAKRELCRTIGALPEGTQFTVIAFASKVWPYKLELQDATKENKEAARAWVMSLKNGANTSLDWALSRGYTIKGMDTIVIVTDGYPGRKRRISDRGILDLLQRLNAAVQARISTFGFKAANHGLLREIAKRTGGDYRRIGG
jgi:hypothetical protein